MIVSDGQYSDKVIINPSCENRIMLTCFTIIKAKKYRSIKLDMFVSDSFPKFGSNITEMEIITPGDQVGVKLGNPVEITFTSDGEIIDLVTAKFTALR